MNKRSEEKGKLEGDGAGPTRADNVRRSSNERKTEKLEERFNFETKSIEDRELGVSRGTMGAKRRLEGPFKNGKVRKEDAPSRRQRSRQQRRDRCDREKP